MRSITFFGVVDTPCIMGGKELHETQISCNQVRVSTCGKKMRKKNEGNNFYISVTIDHLLLKQHRDYVWHVRSICKIMAWLPWCTLHKLRGQYYKEEKFGIAKIKYLSDSWNNFVLFQEQYMYFRNGSRHKIYLSVTPLLLTLHYSVSRPNLPPNFF